MSTKDNLQLDLNQTIAGAVKARVEAEMFAALSGDATLTTFISAALNQPVPKDSSGYSRETEPYVHSVLRRALQEATKVAVQAFIAEEMESIEAEVRKTLRKSLNQIAATLTESLTKAAATTYGVSVAVELKMPRQD